MNYLGSLDFKTFKEEFLDKSTLNKEEYKLMRWHSIYISELEFLLSNGINVVSNDRGIITINDRNGNYISMGIGGLRDLFKSLRSDLFKSINIDKSSNTISLPRQFYVVKYIVKDDNDFLSEVTGICTLNEETERYRLLLEEIDIEDRDLISAQLISTSTNLLIEKILKIIK